MLKPARVEFDGTSFNLFSWTTAMDCWSFSLPAGKDNSCPFSTEEVEGTICNSCYAMTGNYIFSNVLNSQSIRMQWVRASLREDFDGWVAFMIKSIEGLGTEYFRWHDSGDIFSLEYALALVKICKALPGIRFWIPTRTNDAWASTPVFKELRTLKNVVVRKSAIKVDEPATSDVFKIFSSVSTSEDTKPVGYSICPKSRNKTSCGTEECRKCWSKTSRKITYLIHGKKVSEKVLARRKLFIIRESN